MFNYIFIGFMYCGKTSVSKKFAKTAKFSWVDNDERIVEISNYENIPEIFAEKGEPFFRDLEYKAIKQILTSSSGNMVVACGGGLPENKLAIDTIKADPSSKIIYLRSNFKTLLKRHRASAVNIRPLFQDEQKAESLFSRRLPVYESIADVIVDVDGISVNDVAWKCLKACGLLHSNS